MIDFSKFNSLFAMANYFNNDDICKKAIIENRWGDDVWSHFRRMITGCYHDVGDEHLQSYIDEACFRWNTRKMAESERFTLMFGKAIGNVIPNEKIKLCIAA